MQQSMLTIAFAFIALIFGTTTFVYKNRLTFLQSQLANSNRRVRRDVAFDVNDGGNYFPLYTQLSSKSIQRLCKRQWRIDKNRTKPKKQPKHSSKCGQISSITKDQETWKRPFHSGSASKCGQNWLITEFSSGYTLFEYKQDIGHPISIYTLPEAFEGTDHTAYCGGENKYLIYFSSNLGWQSGSIIKFDLRTQKHIQTVLIASENPLYNGTSNVDLEVDGDWLWAIYRLPAEKKLAVTKFSLSNLKQAGGWIIEDQRMIGASNSFISCSTLYSVNYVNGKHQIEAIYEFDSNQYISSHHQQIIEWPANGHSLIQSLHMDSNEDKLSIFENGSIYSVFVSKRLLVL